MTPLETPPLPGCGMRSRENPCGVISSDHLGGTGTAVAPAARAAGAGTEGEVGAP